MAETPPGPSVEETSDEVAIRDTRVRWGTMLKYVVIGIVTMFLLLVLLDKVLMPWYVKLGAVETVPNVVGVQFVEAERQLEKLGFEVKKGEPRFDDRYAAGTVVMQLPYGGSQTKQGRRIYLTLSRGAEVIPVPDLTGMALRDARISLMRSGFDIGDIDYDHNDTIMKDLIYAQSIAPRQGARPGALVNVMISRGPTNRLTMMPNLLSLDLEQARSRLENAGLVLGVVSYKEDPTYVKNAVMEQGVAPYAQVTQGAAVDVTVSGTPDPDESGLSDEGEAPPAEVENLLKPKPTGPPRAPVSSTPMQPKGPVQSKPSVQKSTAPKSAVQKPAAQKPAHTPSQQPPKRTTTPATQPHGTAPRATTPKSNK